MTDEKEPVLQRQPKKLPIATVLARFRTMKIADKLPQHDLSQETKVQIWTNYGLKAQMPYFQDFTYPIEQIKFIPEDEAMINAYEEMLIDMNAMYEDLNVTMNYAGHVVHPAHITAGRIVVGRMMPFRRDVCAVAYGNYQRVMIVHDFDIDETNPHSPPHLIQCHCVDLGIDTMIDFRQLFYLFEDYANLPPYLIEVPLDFESLKMTTLLQHILLYDSSLYSATFILNKSQRSNQIFIESTKFPVEDFIQKVTELVEKMRAEPASKSSEIVKKAKKKLIPFSSFTPIFSSLVNFGSPNKPAVYLEPGAKLDVVITSVGSTGELRLIPYRTFKQKLLKKFDFDSYLRRDSKKCPCLKDGYYFLTLYKGDTYRCRVLKRAYKGFLKTTRDQPKDLDKKVKVLLVDCGKEVTVKATDLKYLPPVVAKYLPSQAVIAYWLHFEEDGIRQTYDWDEDDWDTFGKFAINNRFTAVVQKIRTDENGLHFLLVDLYDPGSGTKLDPRDHFWQDDEGRRKSIKFK